MLVRVLLLATLGGMTVGCAQIPDALQIDEGVKLTNFSHARTSDSNHVGKIARWGGVIAKVENLTNSSVLEVVNFELKSSTRPIVKDETQGRFRIYYQGLLDPVIYKEGRSVTVLGKISASEKGKIGEHEYLYPVIHADTVHLWKEIKEVDVRISHHPMWYTPSMWFYPHRPYSPYYPRVNKKSTTKAKK